MRGLNGRSDFFHTKCTDDSALICKDGYDRIWHCEGRPDDSMRRLEKMTGRPDSAQLYAAKAAARSFADLRERNTKDLSPE